MGFGGVGMWEIVLIFLVVLLLFGAKRLPEIGSSLGKGIREFKSSVKEIEDEIKSAERQALAPGERPDSEKAQPADEGDRPSPGAPSSAPEGGATEEERSERPGSSGLKTSG